MGLCRHWKPVARCLFSGLLFLISAGSNLFISEGQPVELFLALQFGGIRNVGADAAAAILSITPMILFFYLYGPYFREDFSINFVYVVTRSKKKSAWIQKKALGLLAELSVSWLILLVVHLVIGLLSGRAVQGSFLFYLTLFLCNVLPVFVLVYGENLLSLWLGSLPSFILTTFFYFGCLLLAAISYTSTPAPAALLLYCLLPPIGGMYMWHAGIPVSTELRALFPPPIEGFSLWISLGVCLLWVLLLTGAAHVLMNRFDLTGMIKEGE